MSVIATPEYADALTAKLRGDDLTVAQAVILEQGRLEARCPVGHYPLPTAPSPPPERSTRE